MVILLEHGFASIRLYIVYTQLMQMTHLSHVYLIISTDGGWQWWYLPFLNFRKVKSIFNCTEMCLPLSLYLLFRQSWLDLNWVCLCKTILCIHHALIYLYIVWSTYICKCIYIYIYIDLRAHTSAENEITVSNDLIISLGIIEATSRSFCYSWLNIKTVGNKATKLLYVNALWQMSALNIIARIWRYMCDFVCKNMCICSYVCPQKILTNVHRTFCICFFVTILIFYTQRYNIYLTLMFNNVMSARS